MQPEGRRQRRAGHLGSASASKRVKPEQLSPWKCAAAALGECKTPSGAVAKPGWQAIGICIAHLDSTVTAHLTAQRDFERLCAECCAAKHLCGAEWVAFGSAASIDPFVYSYCRMFFNRTYFRGLNVSAPSSFTEPSVMYAHISALEKFRAKVCGSMLFYAEAKFPRRACNDDPTWEPAMALLEHLVEPSNPFRDWIFSEERRSEIAALLKRYMAREYTKRSLQMNDFAEPLPPLPGYVKLPLDAHDDMLKDEFAALCEAHERVSECYDIETGLKLAEVDHSRTAFVKKLARLFEMLARAFAEEKLREPAGGADGYRDTVHWWWVRTNAEALFLKEQGRPYSEAAIGVPGRALCASSSEQEDEDMDIFDELWNKLNEDERSPRGALRRYMEVLMSEM